MTWHVYRIKTALEKSRPVSFTASWLVYSSTWGSGQQAQSPVTVLQQVDFPGHDVDLSHLLLSVNKGKTGWCWSQGTTALPAWSSHVEAARLQTVSWGQQCRWSLQHTACWEEKQTINTWGKVSRLIYELLFLNCFNNNCLCKTDDDLH